MKLLPLALLAGSAAALLTADEPISETLTHAHNVPPMLEVKATTWDEEKGRSKWLMVKAYSPYCPHCIQYAPTYQAVYEKYSTIMEQHDFRFAELNCIAYHDLCMEYNLKAWPTTLLFLDGEPVFVKRGTAKEEDLSRVVERAMGILEDEPETPIKDEPEQPQQPVEETVEKPVEEPIEEPIEEPVEEPIRRLGCTGHLLSIRDTIMAHRLASIGIFMALLSLISALKSRSPKPTQQGYLLFSEKEAIRDDEKRFLENARVTRPQLAHIPQTPNASRTPASHRSLV